MLKNSDYANKLPTPKTPNYINMQSPARSTSAPILKQKNSP